MDFSFSDSTNKIVKFHIEQGSKWGDIKTNNPALDSIFAKVRGQDEVVTKKHIKILEDLINIGDKQTDVSDNNQILSHTEANKINELISNKDKSRIIDTSKGETLQNYSYIDIMEINKDLAFAAKYNVDASSVDTSNLAPGKYYMDTQKVKETKNGDLNESIEPLKMQDEADNPTNNWSEGINREIRTIKLADIDTENMQTIENELRYIGMELGFNVQRVHSGDVWIEDYTIRRADKKVYIQQQTSGEFISRKEKLDIITSRHDISTSGMAAAAVDGKSKDYAKTVLPEEQVKSETYLEGGNVLNTLKSDGTPGAVIGEESIGYTLKSMNLENTPENVEIAKNKIAQDLGLKPGDVTYVPQIDFHIDMFYHPLGDGEMAVPDYDAGIEMLKQGNIKSMDEATRQNLITKLEELKSKADPILKKAENNLSKSGYKIVKIPCFSVPNDYTVPKINFMNSVGGTSKKAGTFLITNKSDYPELNDAVANVYKKNGIKNVYFVSTEPLLQKGGGIDCLTQEI